MVDEKKVRRAIEAILKAGDRPTVAKVAERIGGSFRDIAPILREWKRDKTETVPPEVSRLVRDYRDLDPVDRETFQRLTCLKSPPRSEMLRRLAVENRKQGGKVAKALKASERAEVVPLRRKK